jgi:hypothetical protein
MAIEEDNDLDVYEQILCEVEVDEIPVEFVDKIILQYHDGSEVEIKGEELTKPIPTNNTLSWDQFNQVCGGIKNIQVIIAIHKLKEVIDADVEILFGRGND